MGMEDETVWFLDDSHAWRWAKQNQAIKLIRWLLHRNLTWYKRVR